MIAPAVIMLVLFFAYPLLKLLIDSLFSIDLFDPATKEFIGLANYINLIQSERFYSVIINTIHLCLLL